MIAYESNLSKMKTSISSTGIVDYFLSFQSQHSIESSSLFHVNSLIGKQLKISFLDKINCVACNTETKKSHFNGYCKKCHKTLAETDECRIKPELCSYFTGGCRDTSWGDANCMKEHVVYLSFTGSEKVGISRHLDLGSYSSRWIDQGATSAIAFFRVKNRLISGLVEDAIRKHISDGTDIYKMLSEQQPFNGLRKTLNSLRKKVKRDIENIQLIYGVDSVVPAKYSRIKHLQYPVILYPEKVSLTHFSKQKQITGKLVGIKGQYLIFDDGQAFNIRKHSGYLTRIEVT